MTRVEEIIKNALKNPKKADLNKDGKLSSYEEKRGAAIEKAMTKEHHLKGNPNAKYVATPAPQGWFDVWEGEPFDITGKNGVLVGKFHSMKDAEEYADKKNAEQGKLEEEFKYSDQAKTALEKIKNKRAARYQYNQPKKSDPTIAQRGGHDKVYKDYLKEDINRIIALEAKREKLQAELNVINSELEKLQASQQQYGTTPTKDLEAIAKLPPSHPQFKGDRRYTGPR